MGCVLGGVTTTMSVLMTNRGAAFVGVAGLIVARMVAFFPREICSAVRLGTGQDVMAIGLVTSAIDQLTPFSFKAIVLRRLGLICS